MNRGYLRHGLLCWLFSIFSFGAHAFSIPQTEEAIAASKLAHIQLNATAGDPDTQYLLGLMRLSGRFVEEDIAKGLYWLRLAAESGHGKAQQALADLYFEGKLMQRDLAKSEHWYLSLAKEGNSWAQFRLGFIYASGGYGVERHCGKAVNQFKLVGDEVSLGNVAWILATCPEAQYRDGVQALELAKQLLATNAEDPTNLDNLAAAYAELGQFSQAIEVQQKALNILSQQSANFDNKALKIETGSRKTKELQKPKLDEFKARLKKYQEHKAYREIVPLLTE